MEALLHLKFVTINNRDYAISESWSHMQPKYSLYLTNLPSGWRTDDVKKCLVAMVKAVNRKCEKAGVKKLPGGVKQIVMQYGSGHKSYGVVVEYDYRDTVNFFLKHPECFKISGQSQIVKLLADELAARKEKKR